MRVWAFQISLKPAETFCILVLNRVECKIQVQNWKNFWQTRHKQRLKEYRNEITNYLHLKSMPESKMRPSWLIEQVVCKSKKLPAYLPNKRQIRLWLLAKTKQAWSRAPRTVVTLALGKPFQWRIQAERPSRLWMASSVFGLEKTSLEASGRTLGAVCMQSASL